MEQFVIGKIIKDLRVSLQMTQKELASSICTQGQLSKIEKGEVIPNSNTLYELASRLDVTIDYLYSMAANPRYDYAKQTFELMREAVRERNYQLLAELLENERDNLLFQAPFARQFFLWHRGIVAYYIHHDLTAAVELLTSAVEIGKGTKFVSKRTVEIMNSLAILYLEENDYPHACDVFRECLQALQSMPILEDPKIKIRVLYNYAKALYYSGEFTEAMKLAQQGILICLRDDTMYLLGELYFQRGIALEQLGRDRNRILAMFEKSLAVFALQENEPFTKIVEAKLQAYSA
ncbi:helix-turn-helix domain-containing protein [Tumebacillus sp. ITR2]|uniref:Helix-turn-helix domain-containing protein n=1 Tax=Tumebacillus amylolyticus TaxID=2801339 RepID=A0ABS1JBH0_9BACL|nr:helix-turn-helix domain-containing protein [Tumebacillus amylolyticus]MBL0387625.1 helix-turn-helix domain-containing protein [Tumebacillus amylolyticus]